jgi:hypothetical protein
MLIYRKIRLTMLQSTFVGFALKRALLLTENKMSGLVINPAHCRLPTTMVNGKSPVNSVSVVFAYLKAELESVSVATSMLLSKP